MVLKKLLSAVMPKRLLTSLLSLRGRLFDIYAAKSYSQEGEDRILERIFENIPVGFYVDVGAHHPRRFSNTRLFYSKGWRGINIEPNPEVAKEFRRDRTRDLNLQMGIANQEATLKYFQFSDPALNSFDSELSQTRDSTTRFKIVATQEIPVLRLDTVLKTHLPSGVKVDFMSIDVEGFDLAVLQSNDWTLFRPTCVLIESFETSLERAAQGESAVFMGEQGYTLLAKTLYTLIFMLQSQVNPELQSVDTPVCCAFDPHHIVLPQQT